MGTLAEILHGTQLPAVSPVAVAFDGSSSRLTVRELQGFRRGLLRWYDANRRDLPWRETRDPYRIWLSEIMLQQTRVAAVLEHYRIFLERFPDVQALASATEDLVLAAWSGLGYYRRARMLHQCAKEIVRKHGGRFGQDSEGLLELPGIGRYTAAAIASIAFGEAVAVVDGNVERVLRRLAGTELSKPRYWQEAQALLAAARPGDSNQAMMELGAMVCVPREPRCLLCPVRKWCVAKGEVQPAALQVRQRKVQIWCSLECSGGDRDVKVRLVQRSRKESLMAGMWELPQACEPPGLSPALTHWRTFRHSITVTDYTVHVLRNAVPRKASSSGRRQRAKGEWVALDQILEMPITGLTRKILRASGLI